MNQILVVEDEADMAATYERLLRRAGYRVVTAGSRADGLQLLKSVRPKLVISDLRLPAGDGLHVLRAACTLDPPPPVIIIITAFASRAAREAALKSGACAFLAKPFGIRVFEPSRGPAEASAARASRSGWELTMFDSRRAMGRASATATASCSSRTRETSGRPASYRAPPAACVRPIPSTSTGPRSFSRPPTRGASAWPLRTLRVESGLRGLRARAFIASGDPLSEDPLCAYEPIVPA